MGGGALAAHSPAQQCPCLHAVTSTLSNLAAPLLVLVLFCKVLSLLLPLLWLLLLPLLQAVSLH